MNYLLITINIVLTIIIICHIYNNWFIIKEGLEGCPASSSQQESNRRRGASRREINSTIKDIKAQIKQVQKEQKGIFKNVKYNKLKRNKEKMDKLK